MPAPFVIIVDDNPGDIALTQEAFAESRIAADFTTAMSGDEALELLQDVGVSPRLPDLILLDLNLPKINGLELLAFVRNHPRLSRVPTVVLTTSNRAQDRERSRQLGAADYLVKPAIFSEFLDIVSGLRRFLAAS
jgi:CheY-like chemotaxis protein